MVNNFNDNVHPLPQTVVPPFDSTCYIPSIVIHFTRHPRAKFKKRKTKTKCIRNTVVIFHTLHCTEFYCISNCYCCCFCILLSLLVFVCKQQIKFPHAFIIKMCIVISQFEIFAMRGSLPSFLSLACPKAPIIPVAHEGSRRLELDYNYSSVHPSCAPFPLLSHEVPDSTTFLKLHVMPAHTEYF